MSMFGLIVAGRLVETNVQQVDVNKCLFPPIAAPANVNHVVVFLTGSQPFPEGLDIRLLLMIDPYHEIGGAVYLSWNGIWQYLGYISNEKPSAIFKVSSARPKDEHIVSNPFGALGAPSNALVSVQGDAMDVAQIGIAVEPLQTIATQPGAGQSAVNSASSFVAFTEAMLTSFCNFAMSFAMSPQEMMTRPNEQYVPMSAVNRWFDKFKHNLQVNPNFWKTSNLS